MQENGRRVCLRLTLTVPLVLGSGSAGSGDNACVGSAREGLLQALKDPGWDERTRGVQALVSCGADAVPVILEALKDPDWRSREAVGRAAAELGPVARPAASALAAALEAGRRDKSLMCESLATALGAIGPTPEGVAALIDMLDHPDRSFRNADPAAEAAMNSLARIGAPAIPALMSHLEWNPEGFNEDWEALARMGPVAVPSLVEALKAGGGFRAQGAINALGMMTPPPNSALPALVSALSSPDFGIRVGAVLAVSRFGPAAEEAVRALMRLLDDPDIGGAAAEALGNIGPRARAAVPALKTALGSSTLSLRLAASGALKKIEGK